jgi:hypothetical protein
VSVSAEWRTHEDPRLHGIVALVFAAGALAALGALVWKIVAAFGAFARYLLGLRPRDVRGTRERAAGSTARPQTAKTGLESLGRPRKRGLSHASLEEPRGQAETVACPPPDGTQNLTASPDEA